ncbi:MAG: hypothetical protein HYS56_03505, partial [Candidatus Omnitrophica bacterium]|nr:hypothetical protein [Candidatus Omnitrophota bacterium]
SDVMSALQKLKAKKWETLTLSLIGTAYAKENLSQMNFTDLWEVYLLIRTLQESEKVEADGKRYITVTNLDKRAATGFLDESDKGKIGAARKMELKGNQPLQAATVAQRVVWQAGILESIETSGEPWEKFYGAFGFTGTEITNLNGSFETADEVEKIRGQILGEIASAADTNDWNKFITAGAGFSTALQRVTRLQNEESVILYPVDFWKVPTTAKSRANFKNSNAEMILALFKQVQQIQDAEDRVVLRINVDPRRQDQKPIGAVVEYQLKEGEAITAEFLIVNTTRQGELILKANGWQAAEWEVFYNGFGFTKAGIVSGAEGVVRAALFSELVAAKQDPALEKLMEAKGEDYHLFTTGLIGRAHRHFGVERVAPDSNFYIEEIELPWLVKQVQDAEENGKVWQFDTLKGNWIEVALNDDEKGDAFIAKLIRHVKAEAQVLNEIEGLGGLDSWLNSAKTPFHPAPATLTFDWKEALIGTAAHIVAERKIRVYEDGVLNPEGPVVDPVHPTKSDGTPNTITVTAKEVVQKMKWEGEITDTLNKRTIAGVDWATLARRYDKNKETDGSDTAYVGAPWQREKLQEFTTLLWYSSLERSVDTDGDGEADSEEGYWFPDEDAAGELQWTETEKPLEIRDLIISTQVQLALRPTVESALSGKDKELARRQVASDIALLGDPVPQDLIEWVTNKITAAVNDPLWAAIQGTNDQERKQFIENLYIVKNTKWDDLEAWSRENLEQKDPHFHTLWEIFMIWGYLKDAEDGYVHQVNADRNAVWDSELHKIPDGKKEGERIELGERIEVKIDDEFVIAPDKSNLGKVTESMRKAIAAEAEIVLVILGKEDRQNVWKSGDKEIWGRWWQVANIGYGVSDDTENDPVRGQLISEFGYSVRTGKIRVADPDTAVLGELKPATDPVSGQPMKLTAAAVVAQATIRAGVVTELTKANGSVLTQLRQIYGRDGTEEDDAKWQEGILQEWTTIIFYSSQKSTRGGKEGYWIPSIGFDGKKEWVNAGHAITAAELAGDVPRQLELKQQIAGLTPEQREQVYRDMGVAADQMANTKVQRRVLAELVGVEKFKFNEGDSKTTLEVVRQTINYGDLAVVAGYKWMPLAIDYQTNNFIQNFELALIVRQLQQIQDEKITAYKTSEFDPEAPAGTAIGENYTRELTAAEKARSAQGTQAWLNWMNNDIRGTAQVIGAISDPLIVGNVDQWWDEVLRGREIDSADSQLKYRILGSLGHIVGNKQVRVVEDIDQPVLGAEEFAKDPVSGQVLAEINAADIVRQAEIRGRVMTVVTQNNNQVLNQLLQLHDRDEKKSGHAVWVEGIVQQWTTIIFYSQKGERSGVNLDGDGTVEPWETNRAGYWIPSIGFDGKKEWVDAGKVMTAAQLAEDVPKQLEVKNQMAGLTPEQRLQIDRDMGAKEIPIAERAKI